MSTSADLFDAIAPADSVRWGPADRSKRFALFSKSGFTGGLADDLDDNWSLFDADNLDQVFSGT